MEITYTLTKEDFWRFHQFCVARQIHVSPAVLRLLDYVYAGLWCYMAFLLARQIWLFRFLFGYGYGGWKFFFLLHERRLFNLAAYTVLLAYLFIGQKLLFLRKASLQSALYEPTLRILRPDALYSQAGGKKTFLPWHKFQVVTEDKNAVYLFLQKSQAVIIPKRAFADQGASSAFVQAAQNFQKAASVALPITDGAPDHRAWPVTASATVWPPPPGLPAPQTVRIRVLKMLDGEAPDEVRRAWIGLILAALNGPDGPVHQVGTKGVTSGEAQGIKAAYLVPTAAALTVLSQANPAAARWWQDNISYAASDRPLVFPAEACEVVAD